MGAQIDQKSDQNFDRFLDRFWDDFGSISDLRKWNIFEGRRQRRGSSRYFSFGKYDRIRRIRSFFNLREELIDPIVISPGPFEGKRPD